MINAAIKEHLQTLIWAESCEITKKCLFGIVPTLKSKFRDFTGRVPNRSWFYDQAPKEQDLSQLNVYGRFLFLVAILFFTQRRRAEMLMRHTESVFRWLRSIDNPFDAHRRQRPVWDILNEVDALSANMREAIVRRPQDAAELCLQFQPLIDELVSSRTAQVLLKKVNEK